MKLLFTAVALLCMTSAFAGTSTTLAKEDVSLSQAQGKIASIKPLCPSVPRQMQCLAFGSIVTVQVKLSGCIDRLGGFFTKFEVVDGKGKLFFSAINIASEKSQTVRCIAAPIEMVQVNVPFEGEIELVNLNFTAAAN